MLVSRVGQNMPSPGVQGSAGKKAPRALPDLCRIDFRHVFTSTEPTRAASCHHVPARGGQRGRLGFHPQTGGGKLGALSRASHGPPSPNPAPPQNEARGSEPPPCPLCRHTFSFFPGRKNNKRKQKKKSVPRRGRRRRRAGAAMAPLEAVRWARGPPAALTLLDQRLLPHRSEWLDASSPDAAWAAIKVRPPRSSSLHLHWPRRYGQRYQSRQRLRTSAA